MKRGLLIGLAVVAGLVAIALLVFGGTYNSLVQSEEGVSSAWAQVENVYQRRLDLIPNLVETVKGYAKHESETLQAVVEARAKATQTTLPANVFNDPQALTQFEQVQQGVTSSLSRLLAVIEQYPDLKANQNFLTLQTQLEGTENRITVERQRFNLAAQEFNTKVRIFPNNLIASLMGFQRKAYFAADEGARNVPKVEF